MIHVAHLILRQCVRAAKEMDSEFIGLCPQGFESPRCRFEQFEEYYYSTAAVKYAAASRWSALAVHAPLLMVQSGRARTAVLAGRTCAKTQSDSCGI